MEILTAIGIGLAVLAVLGGVMMVIVSITSVVIEIFRERARASGDW